MSFKLRLQNGLARRSFRYLRQRGLERYAAKVDTDLQPLVVLQMGKVGSSTVVAALRSGLSDHYVHHVHFLAEDWIERVEEQYRVAGKVAGGYTLDEHVSASRYLADNLQRDCGGEKPLLISLTRDPIARNVSSFFQAFPVYFPVQNSLQNSSGTMEEFSEEELSSMFLNKFGKQRHQVPLTWFDEHICKGFGLDVFATPFDKSLGYKVLENEQCRLLLLTMEKLPGNLIGGMSELLGRSVAVGAQENVAADKGYGDTYADFKKRLRLPSAYIDDMYKSTMVEHFYTDEDVAKFRLQWTS